MTFLDPTKPDIVTQIIEWESGELDDTGTIELFSELVKSGSAWQLQGTCGRVAHQMIEEGVLSPEGEIL